MGDVTEKYCSKCGTTVPSEARFCIECGTEMPQQARGGADRPTQVDQRGAGRLALLETLRQVTHGEYDVISEAGRGGMASVFLAHDVALDRKVAIKVFAPDVLGLGETIRERFQREARTAASLSHPHIIPIYAVQQSERLLYFVMKYVEGRSLEAVLREEGQLPVAMVMTILTQVGSALDYAHRKGVIHRDIKPGNVMLDQEGYAIVTDFGIAKVAESEGLTLTGSTVGTPAYMSPEQCMGMGVSGASDQYAMGVVTYQMLTGALPFEGESAMTVMYKHTHAPPRHISDLSAAIPRPLANAVMRMLSKAPEDRFPNMASLVETFGALHEDEGQMRTQMISLARSKDKAATPTSQQYGEHHATTEPEFDPDSITSKLKSTPVTPIPEAKPKKKKAVWLIPTAAAAAAFIWFVGPIALGNRTSVEQLADSLPSPRETTVPIPNAPVGAPAVADIDINPMFATIRVGETLTLRAIPIDSSGNRIRGIEMEWASRDPTIMTVGPNGVISGLAPGTTSVDVHAPGHTTTVPVMVQPAPTPPRRATPVEVAEVTITPDSPTLLPGATTMLAVTARDAAGRMLTGRRTQWRSSDPGTITVSGDGTITALKQGSAVITVVVEDRAASIAVIVEEPAVARLTVSRASAELRVGETTTISASTFDADGNRLDRPAQWRSDDPAVARVSSDGMVTAMSPGSTRIWAARESQSASVAVTVTAPAEPVRRGPDPDLDRTRIREAVAEYGRAIQSESLAAIRRVFPTIPPASADGFAGFFGSATDLVVTLAVQNVELRGDQATVKAGGRYDFRMDGSARNTEFQLEIDLIRAGEGWQIAAVR